MGIRNINKIYEKNNIVIKIVKESKLMYENEKDAYNLLNKHIPKMISFDDKKSSIVLEKINGKRLSKIKIDEKIVIKLAKAIKYMHSHTENGKCFIHGDLHKDNIIYYNNEIYFIDFSCSKYDTKEVDYAAIEIHIIKDKKLLNLFYKEIGENINKGLIRKEKVKHALSHLEWANEKEFNEIYKKSKKIIEKNDDLIKEDDFDYLGLIKLKDNSKIEKLVSKVDENIFVSRSKEYYKKKTYNELVIFREKLKRLFPLEIKKAFVVLEYMLNASYRAFYEDYKRNLEGKKSNLEISRRCMEEDVKSIIDCLENKVTEISKTSLRKLDKDIDTENRLIEADHKMLLYKSIKNLKDCSYIVSPLYSGVLIGPFFKIIHGLEYEYVKFGVHDQNMKSLYDEGNLKLDDISINKNFPKKIDIIDGNIGSGLTLIILRKLFEENNIKVKLGSLEISYEYMDKNNDFSILGNLDYKTYVSTRHHTITDDIVQTLCKNPNNYIKKLRSYGMQNEFLSDIELLYNRGKSICDMHNIEISSIIDFESNFVLSMDIMNKKIRYLESYPIEKAISIIRDYPKVNIIDLDRFYGDSQSLDIIKKIMKIKKVRVGGGVRTKEEIELLLNMGADKVIIGTHATKELLKDFDPKRIIVGLDSIDRRTNKKVDIVEKIKLFEPYCSEFNYVSVECDGKAKGGDVKNAIKYSKITKNIFNCVGGISSKKEMEILKKHNIGCTIGRKVQEGYFE